MTTTPHNDPLDDFITIFDRFRAFYRKAQRLADKKKLAELDPILRELTAILKNTLGK